MVHSGEKSNQCNQCHYVCCDPSALRRHLKTHIREMTMQSVSICISPGRKFEEAFVKRWRKERRTLLHFFVVYDLQGGCFDLFRVEDSKIQTKKWKFQFKHFPVGYLCFPFFGRDFGIFNFFWLIKGINAQRNIREKYSEKIPSEYEYEYYSVWENHPNTNTNNIRIKKIIRIQIRIIFGFKKPPEYEYEY